MDYVIRFLFIFLFCSFAGWLLEVAFRSIKAKRLINPGFLTGCCLPIYGFGWLFVAKNGVILEDCKVFLSYSPISETLYKKLNLL